MVSDEPAITSDSGNNLNRVDLNSGDLNSGDLNSGDLNSGDLNSGDLNSGDLNRVDLNSGDLNSGDLNSGDPNSGDPNSGDPNSGDPNSGDPNSGDPNSGDPNSGDPNSGDPNSTELDGVRAMVTGGTSGLGLAMAERAGRRGRHGGASPAGRRSGPRPSAARLPGAAGVVADAADEVSVARAAGRPGPCSAASTCWSTTPGLGCGRSIPGSWSSRGGSGRCRRTSSGPW